jgi:hypothetical protein
MPYQICKEDRRWICPGGCEKGCEVFDTWRRSCEQDNIASGGDSETYHQEQATLLQAIRENSSEDDYNGCETKHRNRQETGLECRVSGECCFGRKQELPSARR